VSVAAGAVIAAVRRALDGTSGPGVAEARSRLAAQPLAPNAEATARRLPACRFLPDAIGECMFADPALAAALAMIEDELSWRHNPNYSDAAMGQAGYMDAYAYAEVIGPGGLLAGNDFLLGLMILGPGLRYPDHVHPAPELYRVLSGDSTWSRDGGGFEPREPGDWVWHASGVVHAMTTRDRPLLALYIWTDRVAEAARLVQAKPGAV
jgi:quercetin dioxygenase-like cupin family protein